MGTAWTDSRQRECNAVYPMPKVGEIVLQAGAGDGEGCLFPVWSAEGEMFAEKWGDRGGDEGEADAEVEAQDARHHPGKLCGIGRRNRGPPSPDPEEVVGTSVGKFGRGFPSQVLSEE